MGAARQTERTSGGARLALPLVSCIMPTYNRRPFVPRAIAQFLEQDYPNRELVIVDDGTDPIADLVPSDERIRLIRLSTRLTIPLKRNIACEAARGEIICHWDDDDWMTPQRLRKQVAELRRAGADICGVRALFFHSPTSGEIWLGRFPRCIHGRGPFPGAVLCYRKTLWSAHPFHDVPEGEEYDTAFVRENFSAQFVELSDLAFYVLTVHLTNFSSYRDRFFSASPRAAFNGRRGPTGPKTLKQFRIPTLAEIGPPRVLPCHRAHAIAVEAAQICGERAGVGAA